MSNNLELNNAYISEIKTHFQNQYKDKMDPDFVNRTLKSFDTLRANTKHTITLTLQGFLFYGYLKVIDLSTKAKFKGNSGGIGVGLSYANGSLYTASGFTFDDIYKYTVSFQINSLIAYSNANFFNSKGHLLGHIQAAALGVAFIGNGKGKWKTES